MCNVASTELSQGPFDKQFEKNQKSKVFSYHLVWQLGVSSNEILKTQIRKMHTMIPFLMVPFIRAKN